MNAQTNYFLQTASNHIETGNFAAATHILKQILKNTAGNSDAIRLLSVAEAQQGNYENALDYINKAILISPKSSVTHCIKGNILHALGLNEDAIASYKVAIKREPLNADAYNNLGNLYQDLTRHQEALDCYKRAVQLQGKNYFFHTNLGNTLLKLNLFDDSLIAFTNAASLESRYAEAWFGKACALIELKRFNDALVAIDVALKLNPVHLDALINKAVILINLGKHQVALDILDEINLSAPNISTVWSNRGAALEGLARYHEAIASYEAASRLEPEFSDANSNLQNARYSLACLNLKEFNFSVGWAEYEARWTSKGNSSTPVKSSRPDWLGGASSNPLYVWAEQGIGDQILYASMFHDLKKFPQKKIITVSKKLIPIFERSFPDFQILEKGISVPEELYGEHIAMGSLGKHLRNELVSFKSDAAPYLIADQDKTESFKREHGILWEKKICGLSWRSSNSSVGEAKSINLSELEPILKINKINFINLQYGNVSHELTENYQNNGIRVHEIPELNLYEDIDGLSSLVQACDFVITTSNTTAHIAGALGKETLLLVPYSSGRFWYWQDIEGISLWYPSIRLFKQDKAGDWSGAVRAIKEYLGEKFEI